MNKKIASALVGFGIGLASLVSINVSANSSFCYQQYENCANNGGSHQACYPEYVACTMFYNQ